MDTRKRGRPEANANGGAKKSKSDSESSGKTKPCTKFFSTAGCQFGESCHFLHYVPGGYNAAAQMMSFPATSMAAPANIQNGSVAPAIKSKLCTRYNTAGGCRFGDKCHFAHGEWEIGKSFIPSYEEPRNLGPMPGRFGNRMEPPPAPPAFTAGFGASATAKISVDAALAGPIIGKGGVNSKQICRQTGAKLAIRDHESDANLKNIELEGTFEQINEASAMVRELISSISMGAAARGGGGGPFGGGPFGGMHHGAPPSGPANNFKTKLCENFTKGSCTFGDRCHFAHGEAELRKTGA